METEEVEGLFPMFTATMFLMFLRNEMCFRTVMFSGIGVFLRTMIFSGTVVSPRTAMLLRMTILIIDRPETKPSSSSRRGLYFCIGRLHSTYKASEPDTAPEVKVGQAIDVD